MKNKGAAFKDFVRRHAVDAIQVMAAEVQKA
jgi:hypothetical protein